MKPVKDFFHKIDDDIFFAANDEMTNDMFQKLWSELTAEVTNGIGDRSLELKNIIKQSIASNLNGIN